MSDKKDPELEAMAALLSILEPLPPEVRKNVLDYVLRRLGITQGVSTSSGTPLAGHLKGVRDLILEDLPTQQVSQIDLRSVTQEKKPRTANQMVAVVAYYLANLAPSKERRDFIGPDDIKKYFVQASFPLPTAPARVTLVNAKNAGYLDPMKGGQYRLNPVGHNLVAHRLPFPSDKPLRRLTTKWKVKKKPTKVK